MLDNALFSTELTGSNVVLPEDMLPNSLSLVLVDTTLLYVEIQVQFGDRTGVVFFWFCPKVLEILHILHCHEITIAQVLNIRHRILVA